MASLFCLQGGVYSLVYAEEKAAETVTEKVAKKVAKKAAKKAAKKVAEKAVDPNQPSQHAVKTPAKGIHADLDPKKLNVASVSAYVAKVGKTKPLYEKNADLVMPIASITKVMTVMVAIDSGVSLDERIPVEKNRHKAGKNSYSRIRIGSTLKRKDLIRLALMSSENRAAAVLGQSVSGGLAEFVKQMNRKASQLGMKKTIFVDSTGLSVENVSTARDLSLLVNAALAYPMIKRYSTTQKFTAYFQRPRYRLGYGNTNLLVHREQWDVKLSKTGFLNEAGRCLVMAVVVEKEPVIMIMLDSYGKRTPIGDAGRIKRWLQTGESQSVAKSARDYEKKKTRLLLQKNQK